AGELEVARVRRAEQPDDAPPAERAGLMRAGIAQGVERPLHVEDADRASLELDDLALARRDLPDRSDDVPGHTRPLPSRAIAPNGERRSQARIAILALHARNR